MPVHPADQASSSQPRSRTLSTADGSAVAGGNFHGPATTAAAAAAAAGGSTAYPFKRQKTGHELASSALGVCPSAPAAAPAHPPRTPPRKQAPPMYSFSPSRAGNFIDLTADSPGSSRASTPGKSGVTVGASGVSLRPANGFRIQTAGSGSATTTTTTTAAGPGSGGGATSTRKFVIKNFKTPRRPDPQSYFHSAWAEIDNALALIFADDGSKPNFLEGLYKSVENICRHGQAKLLFEKLHYRCREHITGPQVVGKLTRLASSQPSNVDFLRAVQACWHTWEKQMSTVKLVFLYLNQSYLVNSKDDASLDELRVSLFRKYVFENPALRKPALLGACELVTYDRRGESEKFESSVFQDAIDIFHTLAIYTRDFEPLLMSESQSFFLQWSNQQIAQLDLPAFVSLAQKTFDVESWRCDKFSLDGSTARELRKLLETFMVDNRLEFLTDSASVRLLLDKDDSAALTELFTLLQRKAHGALLRPAFEYYIETTGEAVVFDEEREQDMIPRLLALKRRLDAVWQNCFKRQEDLGIGLREAFRKFMNKTKKTRMTHGTDNEKTGEMIAKYVDALLRGGLKAIADDADGNEELDDDAKMSQQLDQVLELFRFLNGKAVFEAFYKKDLARRLLHKTSANDWAEKAMLQRLKAECGANFTSNLESMFRDVDTSREENASFRERRKASLAASSATSGTGNKIPDLEVNVLESSAWPSYAEAPIVIPPDVDASVRAFSEYYKQRFPSRKLEWKHTFAHCQLEAHYDKNYVVIVSAMQAVVLLYFNSKERGGGSGGDEPEPVGFAELAEATKLEEKDLTRTLQSLACARYRVLRKSTKGPEVAKTDTFVINTKFRTDKVRFKINQIQLKETKEENKETHERVAADREFETQAAIVRIMKAKQKITHTDLVTETIMALAKRGKVQPEDIKKQIDKLIDKEYMERIEDNKYEYMA